MIILISPSKQMDVSGGRGGESPLFADRIRTLSERLRLLTVEETAERMSISSSLAEQVRQMHQEFGRKETPSARALYAYRGTVFKQIDADSLQSGQVKYLQRHLRILSGLYGLLRPFDAVRPYRLEMSSSLDGTSRDVLHYWWRDPISEFLDRYTTGFILNLASGEYMKAVDTRRLRDRIITISFKEERGGTFRTSGMYAKIARGRAVRLMAEKQIADPQQLQRELIGGYRFSREQSGDFQWVFIRRSPPAG